MMRACLAFGLEGDDSQLQSDFAIPEHLQREYATYEPLEIPVSKRSYDHATHDIQLTAAAHLSSKWECTATNIISPLVLAEFAEADIPPFLQQMIGDRARFPSRDMAAALMRWADAYMGAYALEPWPEAIEMGLFFASSDWPRIAVYRRCTGDFASVVAIKEDSSSKAPPRGIWFVAVDSFAFADPEQAEAVNLICNSGTS